MRTRSRQFAELNTASAASLQRIEAAVTNMHRSLDAIEAALASWITLRKTALVPAWKVRSHA
jgi:hypothetical protein